MSSPSRRTLPRSAASRPATIRSKVVLPQPDGPSSETNSPAATPRSTPPSTVAAPNDFSARLTSRKAIGSRTVSSRAKRGTFCDAHQRSLASARDDTATSDRSDGHLAIPALDPAVAFLGDELPLEAVYLGVGRNAGRRRRIDIGREGVGFRLQLGLHLRA